MLSGLLTLILMIAFIGICFWAYSPKRKQDFSEAERLPLENDENAAGGKSR